MGIYVLFIEVIKKIKTTLKVPTLRNRGLLIKVNQTKMLLKIEQGELLKYNQNISVSNKKGV